MEFDDKKKVLPTRTGHAIGDAAENRLIDNAGGPNTIVTRVRKFPDGSQTRLKTRGGFPEFVSEKKKTVPPATTRTFVFRHIGETIGVIANKFASGMKVLDSAFAITGKIAYFVSSLRRDVQGFWKDVVRVDNTAVKLNGLNPAFTNLVPALVNKEIPFVLSNDAGNYLVSCTDDATRSSVFLAKANVITSLTTAGAVKSTITPEKDSISAAYEHMYVAFGSVPTGYLYTYAAWDKGPRRYAFANLKTTTTKITPTPVTPYLSQVSTSETTLNLSGPTTAPAQHMNPSVTWTTPPDLDPGFGYASGSMGSYSLTDAPHVVAYGGTAFEVFLSGSISGTHYCHSVTHGNEVGNISGYLHDLQNSMCSVTQVLESSLGELWYMNGTKNVYAEYRKECPVQFLGCNNVTISECSIQNNFVYRTRDYFFSDLNENIHIFVEIELQAQYERSSLLPDGHLNTDNATHPETQLVGSSIQKISARTVLNYRGAEYVLDSRSTSDFMLPVFGHEWSFPGSTPVYFYGGYITTAVPNPAHIPVYSSQADCPGIAYTTKAEEGFGAQPEIYIDMQMSLRMSGIDLIPFLQNSGTDSSGVTSFVPVRGMEMIVQNVYLGETFHWDGSEYVSDGAYRSDDLWSRIFPLDSPIKLQFANGEVGNWQSRLGPGFTGNPPLEISRI